MSLQDFEESRHKRRFGDEILMNRFESLDIITSNIDFDKLISKTSQMFYGFEYTFNNVVSTANSRNIVTGVIGSASTRYPDGGNTYRSFASYISNKWKFAEHWVLSSGLRYSAIN